MYEIGSSVGFMNIFLLIYFSRLQLQRELDARRGDDVRDPALRGVFSAQDGPCDAPRPLSAPTPAPHARSHSDSEALLEEQGATARPKGPTENLFLDALSLDPLGGLEVSPPSKLDGEKRFPCMMEVRPPTCGGFCAKPHFISSLKRAEC